MPGVTITTAEKPVVELSAGQARRVAIAAQQLAGPVRPVADGRERTINRGHLNRLLQSIGLLQIDSVNVLARAHLLPIFSRLGPYPLSLLDGAAWPTRAGDRLLIEAWAHVASLVPVDAEPLLRWRQEKFASEPWPRVDRMRLEHPGFLDGVLEVIAELGPSSAGDIEKALEAPGRGVSGWWEWSITKTACEYLFAIGAIGVANRRGFERRYDLIERVLPAEVARDADADARRTRKRALMSLAASHHGIGTVDRPRRLLPDQRGSTPVGAGRARRGGRGRARSRCDGWSELGYLHRDARMPREGRRGRVALPVRPADLGAGPHRAAVRLSLPHRDLHPGSPSGSTATTFSRCWSVSSWSAGST